METKFKIIGKLIHDLKREKEIVKMSNVSVESLERTLKPCSYFLKFVRDLLHLGNLRSPLDFGPCTHSIFT